MQLGNLWAFDLVKCEITLMLGGGGLSILSRYYATVYPQAKKMFLQLADVQSHEYYFAEEFALSLAENDLCMSRNSFLVILLESRAGF